ncbi:MAG: hypothetical protein ACC653_05735 [Gammaproteobacteria bacterium]
MSLFFNNNLNFRLVILYVILMFSNSVYASELGYHLSIEQWSVPRSVDTLLSIEAISLALKDLRLTTDSILTIHYPGGDEGSLWATELRGWLISLGLSSSRISLTPGSSDINLIDLEVINTAVPSTENN